MKLPFSGRNRQQPICLFFAIVSLDWFFSRAQSGSFPPPPQQNFPCHVLLLPRSLNLFKTCHTCFQSSTTVSHMTDAGHAFQIILVQLTPHHRGLYGEQASLEFDLTFGDVCSRVRLGGLEQLCKITLSDWNRGKSFRDLLCKINETRKTPFYIDSSWNDAQALIFNIRKASFGGITLPTNGSLGKCLPSMLCLVNVNVWTWIWNNVLLHKLVQTY